MVFTNNYRIIYQFIENKEETDTTDQKKDEKIEATKRTANPTRQKAPRKKKKKFQPIT